MIVERGRTPAGASLKNAGFACFGSPTELLSDMETMGIEKALQLVTWRYEGLKAIQKTFAGGLIDFHLSKGYELLENEEAIAHLPAINGYLYDVTGSAETFIQKDALIKEFGFSGIPHLIENRFEGSLHSGKLLNSLFQLAVRMGIQFLFATEVREVQESSSGVKLTMTNGPHLQTERVIYCTNAFTQALLPQVDLVPARGQVLLTAPIANLKINGTFHYQEGYYYFRNLGDRILLGGARNTSFETEYTLDAFTTLPIQQVLERFLNNVLLPGCQPQITQRWAGIMAMGTEKMPVVQQLTERSYCAIRMSGMGVALAPTVGKKIAGML